MKKQDCMSKKKKRKTDKNLIPLNERTKEEQREIAQMGGKKSGEVRRERKKLKELLEQWVIPLLVGILASLAGNLIWEVLYDVSKLIYHYL